MRVQVLTDCSSASTALTTSPTIVIVVDIAEMVGNARLDTKEEAKESWSHAYKKTWSGRYFLEGEKNKAKILF